jgi:hypothetical protein
MPFVNKPYIHVNLIAHSVWNFLVLKFPKGITIMKDWRQHDGLKVGDS